MPDPSTTTSEKIQRERLDLRALQETSQLLSSSLDVEFVLNNLLLIGMTKLFVTRGVVLLDDPVSSAFRVAAVKGIGSLKVGDRVPLPSASDPAVFVKDDVPESIRGHRIGLLMPIVFMNRLIGYVGLGTKLGGEDFSASELEFIQSLISISSAAIHNSIMVDELKQANRDLDGKIQKLNTLFDLSQEFNAIIDRDHLLKLLSFALMGQFLIGRYMLLLRRDENGRATDRDDYMCLVTSRGINKFDLTPDSMRKLCALEQLLLLHEGETPPQLEPFREAGIELILPLRMHGKTEGVLCLGRKMTGQAFELDDVEFLSALGNLSLVSLQNTYLVEEQIEKERLEEEMRLAREIQEGLLPRKLPVMERLDVAAIALPSREVGGDYFDVAELEGGRLLLAIADVTGKGVPASLLMANIQACIHVLLPIQITLTDATALINRVIHRNTGFDKFITFFWAIYEKGSFRYVNAGHNPPMYVKKDGSVRWLKEGGILLGVFSAATYDEEAFDLEEGDVIALFTDGVTEAQDEAGEEFGEERLQQILIDKRSESAAEIMAVIQQEVRRFAGSENAADDFTMVIVKAK